MSSSEDAVGAAASQQPQPLKGRRILVTRAPHQASALADLLREAGAEPILIPTIEIAPPASFAALDAALTALGTYDWLVFTSANAVEAFHRRAQFHHITRLARSIAVIGPATGRAAQAIGLPIDLMPIEYTADSLAAELAPQATGKSFLLVRAAEARDVIPEALTAAGGMVTIAEAYRNQLPADSITEIKKLFATPATWPDAITFTSASTARNLCGLLEASALELPPEIIRASIGPITSQALCELELPPQLEAKEATIPSLVDVLAAYFANLQS